MFTVTPETNKVCSQRRVSIILTISRAPNRWCKSYRKSRQFLEKLLSMLPITVRFLIEMKPFPNFQTENLVIRQDNKLCVSILGEVGNIQWDSCQGWRDHFSPGHPIPTAMPAQKLFASHRSTPLLQVFFSKCKTNDSNSRWPRARPLPITVPAITQASPSLQVSYMITSVHYASTNCPAVFFLFLTSQITAAHILPILQLLKPDFADSSVPAFSLSAGFGSRSNPRGKIPINISLTRAA